MKIKYYINFLLPIAMFFMFPMHNLAQVTIGSTMPPESGALLQLKETEGPGSNASRGLGLPRVNLTQITGLGDIGIGLDAEEHTGLLIYSTNTDYCGLDFVYQGPYVWSGLEWVFLGKKMEQSSEVHTFTDMRDGEQYRYRDFGPIAGTWMLDDMRAITYDGPGTNPINSGASQSAPHTRKQFAYPAPSGGGIDPLFYNKQPAIGILYTWAAAINVDPANGGIANPGGTNEGENGSNSTVVRQGICPQGWHVPSDKEWNDIELVIAQNPTASSTNSGTTWDDAWRTTKGLRPASNDNSAHGRSMKTACLPIAATGMGPTNGLSFLPHDGGFNIMLVGDLLDETIQFFGTAVTFWSSSASDGGAAWARKFTNENEGVIRSDNNRARLYSIRCKMD